MNQSFIVDVPASGAKVEIVFPVSVGSGPPTTLTMDIPAPGGAIKIDLTPNVPNNSKRKPMLFSSLPMPWDKPPVVKYTPISRPQVEPRVSSYVPQRPPSPEPDVHLEDPPPIPANLSDGDLVMYGYLVDDKFCEEKGFRDSEDASDDIGACIDELRIAAFAKMATFPDNNEIELFYFALRDTGGPICTVGNRGVPAIKLKELEAKMGLKPACWISFDQVSQGRPE